MALVMTIAFGMGTSILGAALLRNAWREWPMAAASQDWIRTSGLVTAVHAKHGRRDRARVEYTYTVLGRTHRSERMQFMGGVFSNTTRDLARQVGVGDSIAVYYDPRNAAEAVLLPGASSWRFGLFGLFALGMLTLGVLTLVWGVPGIYRQRPSAASLDVVPSGRQTAD